MPDSKKTWTRPELVVMVRGRVENRVLAPCKVDGIASGPDKEHNSCEWEDYECDLCSTIGTSEIYLASCAKDGII